MPNLCRDGVNDIDSYEADFGGCSAVAIAGRKQTPSAPSSAPTPSGRDSGCPARTRFPAETGSCGTRPRAATGMPVPAASRRTGIGRTDLHPFQRLVQVLLQVGHLPQGYQSTQRTLAVGRGGVDQNAPGLPRHPELRSRSVPSGWPPHTRTRPRTAGLGHATASARCGGTSLTARVLRRLRREACSFRGLARTRHRVIPPIRAGSAKGFLSGRPRSKKRRVAERGMRKGSRSPLRGIPPPACPPLIGRRPAAPRRPSNALTAASAPGCDGPN